MNKQLKKKVEQKLVRSMEGILSGIHAAASEVTRKKIKEAGKIVARKFVKAMEADKKLSNGKQDKIAAKKDSNVKYEMPKRAANGKFMKKKK